MKNFSVLQRKEMENWRMTNFQSQEPGKQNGKVYQHILPIEEWPANLWPGIRKELLSYLIENQIQHHTGVHNLLSSWILCANLYFPLRINPLMRDLMTKFLKTKISDQITDITDVELEFAFHSDHELHPSRLLGEAGGKRGSSQTSPDVAFKVKTKNGTGIILVESKYTEHSFYRCSARRTSDNQERAGNPDPSRCLMSSDKMNYQAICHQTTWGRKYWENLKFSSSYPHLNNCPAATSGYQLFRQQSLAEGIAMSGEYDLVVSAVAFDERNEQLIKCLKKTGINDFRTGWNEIFQGKAIFKTWSHQEWVSFVRENHKGELNDWIQYLDNRYKY